MAAATPRLLLVLLAVSLSARAKDARQWRECQVRYGQRVIQAAAPRMTVNIGGRRPLDILVDTLSRPRDKKSWLYILDAGSQFYVGESKSPLNVDIDVRTRFAAEAGYLYLLDQAGRTQKLKIISQMSATDAEAMAQAPGSNASNSTAQSKAPETEGAEARGSQILNITDLIGLAGSGDPISQFALGERYLAGYGFEQNDREAFEWFRLAAEHGNINAEFRMGNMYQFARSVRQDDTIAAVWYRQAAERGHAEAQNSLGWLVWKGRTGYPPDLIESHMWFNLASFGGARNASKYRDSVAAQMTPDQIEQAQRLALEWKPKN